MVHVADEFDWYLFKLLVVVFRQSSQGGGNVGEGYEKLIFAILRLSVIIASGAGMPRCPACRIICGGNEV